jgi:hypothetical protein
MIKCRDFNHQFIKRQLITLLFDIYSIPDQLLFEDVRYLYHIKVYHQLRSLTFQEKTSAKIERGANNRIQKADYP